MTSSANNNDRRVLSPSELLAEAKSDTDVLRLRTVRDVLPAPSAF